MDTFKKNILTLLLTLLSGMLSAQTQNISGRLIINGGNDTMEGLPYASILIMEQDSSLVKGTTSNEQGYFQFNFPTKKNKTYIFKASYIGFTAVYKSISPNKEKNIRLDNIKMEEQSLNLKEVTITAQAPEIEQVEDTTIINASIYKTPEGAYLEELIKRIPGMDYDTQNQSITYNGIPIKEININGESFFAGNNNISLKNLPAELVSKIKVYDKKSELEKITGVSTGDENYVLDLQTKKEFNGTLLASGKVGAGNYNKKDFELTSNYFKKGGENLSVIARSGNRNMNTDYKENRQDNVALNFTKKFKKELTINGNVTYNHNQNGSETTAYNEQYLTTGNKYRYSTGGNTALNRTIASQLGVRWNIDEKTFFNFSGSMNFSKGDNTNNNHQATFNENPELEITDPFKEDLDNIPNETKINEIRMNSQSLNNRHQYSFKSNFTRRFNEKGSSISLTTQYNQGDGENDNFSISSTTYYQLENYKGNDSILYRNQYKQNPSDHYDVHFGLVFTQPFTKKLRFQLSYGINYSNQDNQRNTYDLSRFMEETDEHLGFLPPDYQTGYTDSLSNRSHSHTLGHEIALRMNYASPIWHITAGISVRPEQRSLEQKTGLLQADTTLHSAGFRPVATVTWKKNKSRIRLNYQGNTTQPSLSNLISLTDNSNPLNITHGNPNLKSTYSQSVRLEAQNTQKGLFATLEWGNEINSQTRAVIYDQQTGGRETYPVNINGKWNTRGTLRYQKRIKKLRISAQSGSSFAQNISLINENKSEQPDRSKTRDTGINSRLRISYLPEWGSFDISGNWRFQHSANSLRETNIYTRNYSLNLDAFVDLPSNLQLRTDAAYTFRNGTNIQKDESKEVVLNAGLTWRFLKKKRAEISAYWSDILCRKKDYSRNTSANGFSERHTQQIGSYFIISMKYRFNKPI